MRKLCLLPYLTLGVLLVGVLQSEAKPNRAAQPRIAPSEPTVEADGRGTPLYQPGMITIKVKEGVGPFAPQQGTVSFGLASLDEKAERFQVRTLRKRFRHKLIPPGSGLPDLSRIYRLTFPESFDVRAAAEAFSRDPHVEYAEPMPVYWLSDVPNDSLYSQLQHLPQIMAEEAWDIHHGEDGAQETVVGMSDDALEWFHPDIVDNVWQNLGEDADGDGHVLEFTGASWVFDPGDENAVDDDGNGYVDDFIGWDFINEFNQQDNDPAPNDPGQTHGTHCAGIAAGVTDNQLGIASISWNVKIMAMKHCNDGDLFFDSDPYDGIIYCAENGAHVSTNSWRAYAYSQADRAVIEYATGLGCLVVAAAGNEDWDQVSYPGGYPGCVSVASVAITDAKASYSCYGAPIDVSAPGGDSQVDGGILSTIPGGYGLKSGTSMATPLVAGTLGLIKSYHPEWSRDELLTQLLGTADNIDAQNPGYEGMLGTGRINAFHALDDSAVTVPQELRLSIFEVAIDDEDGDGIIEPGETVGLDPTLQNHAYGVSAFGASFTLATTDPDITVLDGSCAGPIPADDYFVPGDGFEIEIAGDASPHAATLTVSVNALVGIAVGEEMDFELLVAPSGVLVWEGVQGGHDYSGAYIRDFMERIGLDVTYPTTFPATLSPFDAVFLSFGSYGTGNTPFSYELALAVYYYLTGGGRVYLEGGDALGYDQAPATGLLNLFGLASAQDGVADNTPVTNLAGQTGTLTEDMLFTSSTQVGNTYIDTYTVGPNGSLAFVESSCGNVAVQGAGTYGQKTFCFSYALGRLADRDTLSNRCNLLRQIIDFFDLSLVPGYLVANLMADTTMGYAPVQVQFTDLSLTDPSFPIISWQWDFDDDGTVDSQDRNPVWTYTESGDYAVTLVVHNGMQSDTLRTADLISVGSYVSGTWSAAGSPYCVSEEIAVADGDVLVIEPGVDVIFTGHYGLRVEGSLQAIGTEQDSILFTAQEPDTGWGGIDIVRGSLDDDSTKIVYATLEYAWAKGGTQPLSSLGGGITIDDVDEVLISHCLIRENRASGSCPEYPAGAGGGIMIHYASPAVTYNSIVNNTAYHSGGISLHEASPLLVGNVIAGNTATGVGGGIAANANCSPSIINNTICGNNAGWYAGGLWLFVNSNPVLRNTILWGNTAALGGDQVGLMYNSCDPDFHYCDVEGGVGAFWLGGGAFTGAYQNCIDADPLFVDPASGDFNLSWANFPADDSTKSPCIDAGDPNPQYNDPDGTRNDIGALYFDQVPGIPQLRLARLSATQCRLWWYTVAGATSYDLYRGTSAFFAPATAWQTITAPDTFHVFSDGVGDPGTNYYFLCRSVGTWGESGDSDRVGECDFGMATAVTGKDESRREVELGR